MTKKINIGYCLLLIGKQLDRGEQNIVLSRACAEFFYHRVTNLVATEAWSKQFLDEEGLI